MYMAAQQQGQVMGCVLPFQEVPETPLKSWSSCVWPWLRVFLCPEPDRANKANLPSSNYCLDTSPGAQDIAGMSVEEWRQMAIPQFPPCHVGFSSFLLCSLP